MQTSIEVITPRIAAEMLRRNTRNRNVRPQYVRQLADSLLRGEWATNGDAIRFDTEGVLLDGQHRLHAVVLSGVEMSTIVIRDLPPDVMKTIDINRSRTAGDYLRLEGVQSPNSIAACAKLIIQWDRDRLNACRQVNSSGITTTQIANLIEKIGVEVLLEAVRTASRVREQLPMPPASIALTWFLTSQIDRADAEEFFARLADGQGLLENNPIYLLRRAVYNRALKGGRRRWTPAEAVGMTLKTWNLARKGETRTVLSWKPDEAMPDPV